MEIFFLQQRCRSEHSTIYFNQQNQTTNFVVSRDLDVSAHGVTADLILDEQFEFKEQIG